MKLPVLEMFVSIQGEGIYTGEPSLFVRVGGCNLRCVFGNTRCDTPYSSFECEEATWKDVDSAVEAANKLLEQNPNVRHLVITGGEPMLYQDAIKDFISKLQKSLTFTIETNGSLPCKLDWWEINQKYDEFGDVDDCDQVWIDMFSISPKLSTSVDKELKFLTLEQMDRHDKARINIKNLASYIQSINTIKNFLKEDLDFWFDMDANNIPIPTYQLKFVYSGPASVTEIHEIIEKLAKELKVSYQEISNHVLLMPEGTSNEHLDNISKECAEVCIKNGWRFCDRLHIRIWGDKRGV